MKEYWNKRHEQEQKEHEEFQRFQTHLEELKSSPYISPVIEVVVVPEPEIQTHIESEYENPNIDLDEFLEALAETSLTSEQLEYFYYVPQYYKHIGCQTTKYDAPSATVAG